jgi:hypothetical protein
MKKLIALLVITTLLFVSVPSAFADDDDGGCLDCWDDGNQAYDTMGYQMDVITSATITGQQGGGGGGEGGDNGPPVIKCKWEYDLDVYVPDCDPCDPPYDPYHDACPYQPGLQVKPILGGNVRVGYFAVVTDPEGVGHVEHIYGDIWHPDLEFKYQIELFPVGFDEDGIYDKTIALGMWDHVMMYHFDLIKLNPDWQPAPGMTPWEDVLDELNEELAYIYYGEAEISYCQPGGFYFVGLRGHDMYDAWCDYLYNWFWYCPTSAVEIDFGMVDYETVAECTNKWVGGDHDMFTPTKPTVRNIGNTPVYLTVMQDDMDFGQTSGEWNVEFDARLSADGDVVVYDPFQEVVIPGVLELCTLEKLDFSIHVFKGMPGFTYTGWMKLYAWIFGVNPWVTPGQYVGDAPLGVPQHYMGPLPP